MQIPLCLSRANPHTHSHAALHGGVFASFCAFFLGTYFRKEPYVSVKEPYVSAKKPDISAK